jgi:hypothetical protein
MMVWEVNYDFFVGGAVMAFAIVLMGLVFPFPTQGSFIIVPAFVSCIIIAALIFINLIEREEQDGIK